VTKVARECVVGAVGAPELSAAFELHQNIRAGDPAWIEVHDLCALQHVLKPAISARVPERFEGMVKEWIAEARTPEKPDLAWALRAILDQGQSGLYGKEAPDLAAHWIADRGLRGDRRAKQEVWSALRRLARREDRAPAILKREALLIAAHRAAQLAGSRIGAGRLYGRQRQDPDIQQVLGKAIDDALLVIVRRDLRAEGVVGERPGVILEWELDDGDDWGDKLELELKIAWLLNEAPLSHQQREIVALLTEGNVSTIEAVAGRLGLASSGVRTQLARIREKIAGRV
jgi:DNA-binding CsgD family transcriptional regulator